MDGEAYFLFRLIMAVVVGILFSLVIAAITLAEADGDEDDLVRCPGCGKVESPDGFDVIGADEGHLFCTDCHCHFGPDEGDRPA